MQFALLSLLCLAYAEEHQNEVFVVYPGGEEHTFKKTMVSYLLTEKM